MLVWAWDEQGIVSVSSGGRRCIHVAVVSIWDHDADLLGGAGVRARGACLLVLVAVGSPVHWGFVLTESSVPVRDSRKLAQRLKATGRLQAAGALRCSGTVTNACCALRRKARCVSMLCGIQDAIPGYRQDQCCKASMSALTRLLEVTYLTRCVCWYVRTGQA